jgi:hypothetical protein
MGKEWIVRSSAHPSAETILWITWHGKGSVVRMTNPLSVPYEINGSMNCTKISQDKSIQQLGCRLHDQFTFIHNTQISSGACPAPYSVSKYYCLFLLGVGHGVGGGGAWSWPLTSTYCQCNEWWSYTSSPSYVSMAWCLINYAKGQFYLYS